MINSFITIISNNIIIAVFISDEAHLCASCSTRREGETSVSSVAATSRSTAHYNARRDIAQENVFSNRMVAKSKNLLLNHKK